MVNAEVIAIGDELLIGQVINTNAAWIGQRLSMMGIKNDFVSTVGDQKQHILSALQLAAQRSQIIFITGGLGPTKDDITKAVLCEYFQVGMRSDEGVLANINRIFKFRGRTLTDLNTMQAQVPVNCKVIPNEKGTAPGMWFEFEGRIYISMPGVPYEMKDMMEKTILPDLAEKYSEGCIQHQTLHTVGIPESFLAAKLHDFENQLPGNISLAYLPEAGMVRLRLSGFGSDKDALTQKMQEQLFALKNIAGKYIYSDQGESLEEVIGNLLRSQQASLSLAESCTGGYLAHLMTSVSGSSDYFMGGLITYSNASKINWLGVSEENITKFGAVSEEVVLEMAKAARERFGSTYALSVSGIAGPNGGSDEKPVGTVWIAIATPTGTRAEKFQFSEDRKLNIRLAAITALDVLRHEILPYITIDEP